MKRFARVNAFTHPRRPARRLMTLAAFLGYPLLLLGYATLVVPGRISTFVWAPIALALMSATVVGLLGIYAYARNRAQPESRELDERQRELATRAHVASYGVIFTAVVVTIAALAIALSFGGPISLSMDALTPVIIAVAVYLPALPSAVLAWIEPDYDEATT